MEKILILHLEDNRADSELVHQLLNDEGLNAVLTRVQTRAEFTSALTDRPWDLILADYALPAFDGFGALAIAQKVAPDLPFIFVTGRLGEDVVVETLKRGATDYVLKQRMERLAPAVRKALRDRREQRLLREMKERLQESEQRFRLLIDGIRDHAIYLVDSEGRVASWNTGAARIFGYSESEAVGLGSAAFFRPDDQREHRCERLLREAERSERVQEELWQVRKNGEAFWADVTVAPLLTGKRLCGYAVITHDITEHRRVKAQIEEDRQERARSQERFLSHISHELRSPLATIVDFTSIIREGIAGAITAEQDKYLEIVLQAANRLGVMVNCLLDLTRSDWRKLPLNAAAVAIRQLIARSCESLRATAAHKQITLADRATEGELPLVFADPLRVQEVLTNLLDNAIKYSPSGSVIEVSSTIWEDDPEFVKVSVADNGHGIAPEQASHIFERFYRVSEASGDHPSGLGLGLYISREIVNAHGGELWLDMSATRGSTFCFTLPRFSLPRVLLPVVSPKNLSWESMGLITVQLPEVPSSSAVDFERYLRSVTETLKQTVYSADDLVLPHIDVAGIADRLHIVAFTRDTGLRVMLERIRRRLAASLELQPLQGEFRVTGTLIDTTGMSSRTPDVAAQMIADEVSMIIGLTQPNGAEHARIEAESAGCVR